MARGHSRTRPGGSALGLRARRRTLTIPAPAPTPATVAAPTPAEAQELVDEVMRQVRAQTATEIEQLLDEFDAGELPGLQRPTAGVGPGRSTRPGELIRAALFAHAAGDVARARGYLIEAHRLLGQIVGQPSTIGSLAWDLDASSDNTNADRAFMTAKTLLHDDTALDRAVHEADITGRLHERRRLNNRMLELIAEQARAHREDVVHAMAIRYAEQVDPALAKRVASFDPERTTTLSRVMRALAHDSAIIQRATADQMPYGLCERVLEDIAGDGVLWRRSRLEGLVGAQAEREYLLLYGAHRPRLHRDGDQARSPIRARSAQAHLTQMSHQMRTAHAVGAALHIGLMPERQHLDEIVKDLARRPGRLRVRAARMAASAPTKTLMCEVIYEGLVEGTSEPLRITILTEVASSRQALEADQMRRVHEHLASDAHLASLPAPEGGFVQIEPNGERSTLIPGPSEHAPLSPAPLDAHLGPEPTCAHTQCSWGDDLPFVSLTCDACGDELMRRPMWRHSSNRARGDHARRHAIPRVARVAAIAELNGEAPPGDLEQILAAPPCDDWRREIRNAHAAASPRTRARMTIGEAMRRR